MIKKLTIKNYKSIIDLTLELGKTNVFIGENGCGKTNILEAVAMLSGVMNDRLTPQDLSNVGVRVAKPSLTRSSFKENGKGDKIKYQIIFNGSTTPLSLTLSNESPNNIHSTWINDIDSSILSAKKLSTKEFMQTLKNSENKIEKHLKLYPFLQNYLIYDLNTPALRGQTPQSFMSPMGIHGEGLDIALASLEKRAMNKLLKYKYLISWLDEIVLDKKSELHLENLRLKGNSNLYFSDKYMKKNVLFNSENANEGVLHVLFYLTLLVHKDTPNIFAIDNIETALNPRICRELMKVITTLNKNKQILITTHNPAILDGLDLTNDDIRLFAVRRNQKGHTIAKRIQFKKGSKKEFKLSEMWMNGLLGAIPTNF